MPSPVKALQNTGLNAFRQSYFLDMVITPNYTSSFRTEWLSPLGGGGVAQLGERLNGIQEVRGSIPLASTPRR